MNKLKNLVIIRDTSKTCKYFVRVKDKDLDLDILKNLEEYLEEFIQLFITKYSPGYIVINKLKSIIERCFQDYHSYKADIIDILMGYIE